MLSCYSFFPGRDFSLNYISDAGGSPKRTTTCKIHSRVIHSVNRPLRQLAVCCSFPRRGKCFLVLTQEKKTRIQISYPCNMTVHLVLLEQFFTSKHSKHFCILIMDLFQYILQFKFKLLFSPESKLKHFFKKKDKVTASVRITEKNTG